MLKETLNRIQKNTNLPSEKSIDLSLDPKIEQAYIESNTDNKCMTMNEVDNAIDTLDKAEDKTSFQKTIKRFKK